MAMNWIHRVFEKWNKRTHHQTRRSWVRFSKNIGALKFDMKNFNVYCDSIRLESELVIHVWLSNDCSKKKTNKKEDPPIWVLVMTRHEMGLTKTQTASHALILRVGCPIAIGWIVDPSSFFLFALFSFTLPLSSLPFQII